MLLLLRARRRAKAPDVLEATKTDVATNATNVAKPLQKAPSHEKDVALPDSSSSSVVDIELDEKSELSLPVDCEYHAFLTHSWVKDGLGRDTHSRVSMINDYLKSRGLVTWFDGDRMEGEIVDQMVNGIDKSAVIVVFVTTAYIEKVASRNPNDNCRKEFNYATRTKTASKMVPVPMEPACLNPSQWSGPVNMELGGKLYKAQFSGDVYDDSFKAQASNLYDEIVRVAGREREASVRGL